MKILTLCTGNVARSVMLAYMLSDLAESNGLDWRVRSAGTHVTEGVAMSARTRDALLSIPELGEHRYGQHRSHQLTAEDCEWSDLILAAEYEHAAFVRRHFGGVACAQLGQFATHAPLGQGLDVQLASLRELAPDESLDVKDPAGGTQADYDECARQLWRYALAFTDLVSGAG